MKILLCSPTFQTITHGPAKFAHLLLGINEKFPEHEIRILTEGIDKEIPSRIYKLALHYPRPVHALGKFLRMWSYHREAFRRIRKEFPFDVIVYNDAIQGLGSALLSPSSVKTVGMLNDDEYLSTTFGKIFFSRKWLIKWLHKPFQALGVRLMSATITCSSYLAQRVQKQSRASSGKVVAMYQSVNLANWPNSHPDTLDPSKKISVLFVKSDYPRGGLPTLITALTQLQLHQFELIIIGPLREWAPKIERLYVKNQNIKYTFMGPQPQSVVFEKMKTSDILCVPSLREGLGVVNIEGLAVGIPVVSTSVGGIPEVLGNGACGWLAEPGDPGSLAKAILSCINHPEERRKKREAGRKRVEEHFGHHAMIRNFIRILEQAGSPTAKPSKSS